MDAEIKTAVLVGSVDLDVEAGRSSCGDDADGEDRTRRGEEEDEEGEGAATSKKETVVLRLGEGKLTGPMRFITCYATVFTFTVMVGIIVWLLIISPPFTVEPEVLPGRAGDPQASPSDVTRTSVFPFNTETPAFSSDFNQA